MARREAGKGTFCVQRHWLCCFGNLLLAGRNSRLPCCLQLDAQLTSWRAPSLVPRTYHIRNKLKGEARKLGSGCRACPLFPSRPHNANSGNKGDAEIWRLTSNVTNIPNVLVDASQSQRPVAVMCMVCDWSLWPRAQTDCRLSERQLLHSVASHSHNSFSALMASLVVALRAFGGQQPRRCPWVSH